MIAEQAAAHLAVLRRDGVVLLRGVFPREPLSAMEQAAGRCFRTIVDGAAPEHYNFTPFSQSVLLAALLDYGISCAQDLMAPLAVIPERLPEEILGAAAECRWEQSWVRKRFTPAGAPRHYQPNRWHQDGGLGVRFAAESGETPPMNRLFTCWVPLHACGEDSPSLEFVRRPLTTLLHYTELTEENLRARFEPEDFWSPQLEFGDGLLFLNGTLHRTHVLPEMRHDRLSVEYRFFPSV